MNPSLYSLLSSPVSGTLLGLLTFAAGSALAVFLYRKALPLSRLDFVSNDTIILDNRHSIMKDDLEIRYRGSPIPRASTSVFAFWNSGNQTIHGDQIVSSDPLRIEVPEGVEILQAYIFASTRKVLDVKIVADGPRKQASLTFDFLDHGDGFAVFVGHTGSPRDAAVLGTLRGVKQGPRRRGRSKRERFSFLIGAVVLMLLIFALPYLPPHIADAPLTSAFSLGVSMGVTFLALFGPLVWRQLRAWSFPREFRRDPTLSAILPFLLDGHR